MNVLGWSLRSSRESRRGRPIAAWVERLEHRTLLTLQVSPITTTAGQYFSGSVATFAAGDVQGTLADFQATIYWTGAVNLTTGGFIAPNGPGNYVIYSSNAYARPGSYPVNVVLTGANNTVAQASGTATITDAPLSTSPTTVFASIQTPFAGPVGSFQTSNPYATAADFKASIDWGDGTAPTPGTVSSSGYLVFNVNGQHTYSTVGNFPITVTVTSPGGQVSLIDSTATATALPVSVFPVLVTGNAGEPLSGVTVATFLDPYTTDTPGTFRGIIDWGDGTTNVGAVASQGGGVYSVVGDHTYLATGSYTLNVQVVRIANGQTASTSGTAQIGSPSPSFAFTGGLASVPNNGPFISSGYSATRRPTFDGTAAAFAIVQLFAQPLNSEKELSLGETVADPSGHWSLTTGQLPRRGYLITAQITPPAGYPSEMVALTQNQGLFYIGLSPGSHKKDPPAGAGASPHAGRSRTRSLAALRTLETPPIRVSWVATTEAPVGSLHRPRID